jgi:hypothetical protein
VRLTGSAAPGWTGGMILLGMFAWAFAAVMSSRRYELEIPFRREAFLRYRSWRRWGLIMLVLGVVVTVIAGASGRQDAAVSPVGAAAILAETGDLNRFTSARAVVKHAGLAPRERKSGTFTGRARLSGAGRPLLRAAAWRAVWGCLQTNRVYAARYRHLTTRESNKLKPTQAQTAVAAAILRQLHYVVTHQQAWDPTVAATASKQWR